MIRKLPTVLPALALALALCSPAYAQEAARVSVDLTGIAVAAVGGFFSVLAAVLLAIIQAKIKNQQMAELLAAAVKNSLGKIQQATVDQVRQAEFLHPEMPARLAVGAQYVVDHAPEALAHFGITPAAVADKVEAAIGLREIENNIAISGSATTAVVPPLQPSPPGTTADDLNAAELERIQRGGRP